MSSCVLLYKLVKERGWEGGEGIMSPERGRVCISMRLVLAARHDPRVCVSGSNTSSYRTECASEARSMPPPSGVLSSFEVRSLDFPLTELAQTAGVSRTLYSADFLL